MDDFEDYETPTPLSQFETAIVALKEQISVAILDSESELARRKTQTLEKLLLVQKYTPETLNPTESIAERRRKRDELMAELSRRLERLGRR